MQRLSTLCRENLEQIGTSFAAWLFPPDTIVHDSPEYRRYFNALYLISKVPADVLGSGYGLFAALVAADQSNPFAIWESTINRALALMKVEGEFKAAADVLTDHLIDVRDLHGFGYAHMSATTHWYISQSSCNLRDRDATIKHAEQALSLTCQIGDHPNYADRYLKWLWNAHRYFGESQPAGEYAARLGQRLTTSGNAAEGLFYRRQADLLAVGEPLTRVTLRDGRHVYELGDMPDADGVVLRGNVERNRMSLLATSQHMECARIAMTDRRFDEGFAAFRQAADTDPHDPSPHFEVGKWSILCSGFAEAVDALATCERLAPGWPDCRRALWLAERWLVGDLDPTDIDLLTKPWMTSTDAEDRLTRIEQLVKRYPGWALSHLYEAEQLRSMGRSDESVRACQRGLNGVGAAETRA